MIGLKKFKGEIQHQLKAVAVLIGIVVAIIILQEFILQ
jgi:hypothetical protein